MYFLQHCHFRRCEAPMIKKTRPPHTSFGAERGCLVCILSSPRGRAPCVLTTLPRHKTAPVTNGVQGCPLAPAAAPAAKIFFILLFLRKVKVFSFEKGVILRGRSPSEPLETILFPFDKQPSKGICSPLPAFSLASSPATFFYLLPSTYCSFLPAYYLLATSYSYLLPTVYSYFLPTPYSYFLTSH